MISGVTSGFKDIHLRNSDENRINEAIQIKIHLIIKIAICI